MKLSSQKKWAYFLLLLYISFGFILSFSGDGFVWYWIFGICLGFLLQRSHICFVSAACDPILSRSTDQLRALLIGILITSFGISVIKFLSNGTYDTLGVSAISIPLILGAFLFGIGMVLSGCCCSGMHIRIAEGYFVHIITLFGVLIGYGCANIHYQSFWSTLMSNAPFIFLPEKMGWTLGIIVNIVLLLLTYFIALKIDIHTPSSDNTSYLEGCIILGIICILHVIILKAPWSVSGAFYWVGTISAQLFSRSENISHIVPSIAYGSILRNVGLIAGSLVSVLLRSRFRFQKIRSWKQVFKSALGGFLMGYGACIADGCNITSFFTAIASLSLSGWIFMCALFVGAYVGIKLLYKMI